MAAASAVKANIPADHGYILISVPYEGFMRMTHYASNLNHHDAIRTLTGLLAYYQSKISEESN